MATYSNTKPPRKRANLSMVAVIVLILSLALSLVSQLNTNNSISSRLPNISSSLLLVGQVFVGFIAILASLSEIVGFSIRDLFGGKPPSSNVEEFPFYVIQDIDELVAYLYPTPKKPILPDKNIPFSSRIKEELDSTFRTTDRILVRGRSKTGKTREVTELIRRFWYLNPTILLLKNHVDLSPSLFVIPKNLPTENLILFIDDIDRFCETKEDLKNLNETIDFISGLCRKQSKLKVIATVRQEPEIWGKIRYRKEDKLWKTFSIIEVNPLTKEETLEFIKTITTDNKIRVDDGVLSILASKNNGSFLNVILSTRNWMMKEQSEIKAEDIESFNGELALTWDQRYKNLLDSGKLTGPIYAAISIIERLNTPLVPEFVVDIATELSFGKVYHFISSVYTWIISRIGLSPALVPFTNSKSKHRNRFLLVFTILLIVYLLSYLMFMYVSVNYLSSIYWLENNLPIRLKILSPIIMFLIIYMIFWAIDALKNLRRRRMFSELGRLMVNEIRVRSGELLPYEGQFAGKGESLAIPMDYFLQNENFSYSLTKGINLKVSEIYWKWADYFREKGEFKSAEILANISGKHAPFHPMSSFLLGNICFDREDYKNAIKHFANSVELNKTLTSNLTLAKIAWSYYFDDDLSNAINTAQRLISLDPLFSDAYWIKGICLIRQNQENNGVAEIEKAINLDPQLSSTVKSLIDKLRTRPDYSKISLLIEPLIDNGRHSRKTFSLSKPFYSGLSLALIAGFGWFILFYGPKLIEDARNDSEFNLHIVNVFNKIYPNTTFWVFAKGWSYNNLGNYELAVKYYSDALAIKRHALIYTNRGWDYTYLKQYDNAKNDYLSAIELDPYYYLYGFADPYYGLYYLNGINMDFDEYTSLIEKYPTVPYVYMIRAEIFEDQRKYEEALADWNKAVQFAPEDPKISSELHLKRGIVYFEANNYEAAISDYTLAIKLYLDNAAAYYDRGLVYQIQGEKEKAIADFKRYLELETNTYWIDQAKQRLRELGVMSP